MSHPEFHKGGANGCKIINDLIIRYLILALLILALRKWTCGGGKEHLASDEGVALNVSA